MKSFHFVTPAQRKEECLEILRGFIADIGNVRNGVRLVGREKETGRLLENKMDLLTTEERYKVYGFMEGVFPKHFKRILAVRLQKEIDPKCRELLRAIAQIHSKSTG